MKPHKNVRNIWVKKYGESYEKAKLITAQTKRPVQGYSWSKDGKFILFVKDNNGDENFNVFAVDPNQPLKGDESVPTARNITEGKKVRAMIQRLPENDPDSIIVGLNDRDPAWHDIYKVSISTGKKTLIRKNDDRVSRLIFDNADRIRLTTRSTKAGKTEIISLDGEKPKVIYSCNVFETCIPVRFHKNNKTLYLITNTGDRDLTELVLLDIKTSKETFIEKDPNNKVDIADLHFSEVSDELIATIYNDEKFRVRWKNKAFEKDYQWLKKRLPGMEISLGASTKDENIFKIDVSSDLDPGSVYFFDRRNKKLNLQYRSREKLPRKSLSRMKSISYKSSDGLEIPAYLTLPKGIANKNLPLIVNPHGGPWTRDNWGFNRTAQFLSNRGYAVLQMNFRGSTGYGKKFLDAGNKQWGDLMQDDITWGVKHLVKQGIVDPKRVGIMGGSYGGYATLAGVTFTPDRYAAAVAIVAPSSLLTLLKSFPPYWEAGRTTFYKRMGDPTNPAGKKQLTRQSPLTHASKIKTPLMVVQGANDPRVNKRESDQIVIALRDRKYPVEYLVADDEGHGFRRPVNLLALFAATEKFFAKHLGGRHQKSMTAPVKKRLAEISVDPKTVKLEKAVSKDAKPTINLSGLWDADANAGGQKFKISLDLTQSGSSFTGKFKTPFSAGPITDGKVFGNNYEGSMTIELRGQKTKLKFFGKIADGKIEGRIEGPGIPKLSFTGTKQ